jgi:hypothetical protein
VRYDPAAIPSPNGSRSGSSADSTSTKSRASQKVEDDGFREFLFFGDVESEWRGEGDEDVEKLGQEGAAKMNKAIWEEAAKGWDLKRLVGIFVSDLRFLRFIETK